MIARNSKDGFLAAHWDWLVAGVGLVALVAGGAVLALGGADADDDGAMTAGTFGRRSATGVEAIDPAAYDRAMQLADKPQSIPEISETGASFLVSGRRVFCEMCHKPIPGELALCPLCKQSQPEPEKVILDSDGDGIPDDLELKLGLDPKDASDADADKDGDGFTNAEELAAKTDPLDKNSHPDYLNDLALQLPLKETVLPFFFEKVEQLPGGKNRYYFRDPKAKNDYGGRGRQYNPLEGEEIGKTGFTVKGFEKKAQKVKIAASKGDKALERTKEIYLVTIERKANGKRLELMDGEKRKPVDVQASLVFSRGEAKTFTVVPGDRIELFGNGYRIVEIKRLAKGAEVTLSQESSGKVRTLQTLEP